MSVAFSILKAFSALPGNRSARGRRAAFAVAPGWAGVPSAPGLAGLESGESSYLAFNQVPESKKTQKHKRKKKTFK